jgi:hypothetical protein
MHGFELCLAGAILAAAAASAMAGEGEAAGQPLRLHPENPHYFLFRARPTVLITSGEHYGAVLNLDFDYVRYLDEIQARGLNLTRTFSGVYREIPGSFGITGNTLAPLPNRYISPWARSSTPGYFDGGAKFDLSKWDEAYFKRLTDFLAQASKRGIVVELSLFCPMYDDGLWKANPMNAANNVNGVGDLKKDDVHTLKNGRLLEFQVAVAKKLVTEANPFDNVYFEICNEPYFGGVTLEWQRRIADAILEAEAALPRKHLIAQNIANGSCKIQEPNPAVSIFNFHYCSPPDAVAMNYGLKRVIADDETGFKGSADVPYRPDAWDFLLAGGAVYSNLDYSFTRDNFDGTAEPKAPGGGGRNLRQQLAILKKFVEGFDFIRMTPDNSVIKGGVPEKATARALVEPGKQYAVFVRGAAKVDLVLDLPAGPYKAEWVSTLTGAVEKTEKFDHAGGPKTLSSPPCKDEIALRIVR